MEINVAIGEKPRLKLTNKEYIVFQKKILLLKRKRVVLSEEKILSKFLN